jgi:type I restriction enzyme S subunit
MMTLPSSWRCEAISNIVTETSLVDPKKIAPKEEFLYVDISGIDNKKGVIKEYKRYLGEEAPSRARRKIKENDVLVSTVRPNLNATALVPSTLNDQICSTGFCVLRSNGRVIPKYLYFFTRTPQFVNALVSKTKGASYPAVSVDDVKSIEIPIPPMDTQRKIVTLLERADALRHKREQANQLTETVCRATFLKMFGDLFRNPKGWEIRRLKDICYKITDGTHRTPKYVSDGLPFLSVKNITSGYVDFSDTKFITPEEHAEITKRCKPEKGDILYTKVGTIGIASVVDTDREFSIFVSIALLKPKHEIVNSIYLKWMLNSSFVKNQANKRVRGIGVPDLHLVEIKDFEVAVPPLSEQNAFAKFVTKAEDLRQKQLQSTEKITELFKSLLYKAFKGQLVA